MADNVETTDHPRHGLTGVYTSVVLTLILIIVAAMLALEIFAAVKVAHQADSVSNRVDSFKSQIDDINKNLNSINKALQPASQPSSNTSGSKPSYCATYPQIPGC